ncbi:MAG: SOS response-associated peptidase family protein [Pseudomonadota bacterium]
MCYSAQVEDSYRKYIQMTGADMDIDQFAEVYGPKFPVFGGPKVTIPRAVDRWFDPPKSDGERKVKALIDVRNAAASTALQQELFKQKKRLADAERSLATKATKAAVESKRIATDKSESLLRRINVLSDPKPRAGDGRIFPMQYAPIVVNAGGRNLIRLARYHCRMAVKPASVDRQYPGLYNARRDNIDRYWCAAFGSTHALMLVKTFYENVDRDGKNAVLHFVPKPAEIMLIACVYSVWKDPQDGSELMSFAAVTDEPPEEVAAAGHDRMIINIKPENVQSWLAREGRSDAELQDILSDRQKPYYEHEVLAA